MHLRRNVLGLLLFAGMLGLCSYEEYYEENLEPYEEEQAIGKNRVGVSGYYTLAVSSTPYGDADDWADITWTTETSYTHWRGGKYGLKILDSGPNRFLHAPGGDWSKAFASNRIDYKSDSGEWYSARFGFHNNFVHEHYFDGSAHISDRIHFISSYGSKICVRLKHKFIHESDYINAV